MSEKIGDTVDFSRIEQIITLLIGWGVMSVLALLPLFIGLDLDLPWLVSLGGVWLIINLIILGYMLSEGWDYFFGILFLFYICVFLFIFIRWLFFLIISIIILIVIITFILAEVNHKRNIRNERIQHDTKLKYAESLVANANDLASHRQYIQAIKKVDEALQILPNIREYQQLRTTLEGEIKKEERVQYEKDLKDEQEKRRKKAESLIQRAKDLASRGQYIQAIKTVDEALQILPDTKEYKHFRAELVKNDPKPDLAISLQTEYLKNDSWQKISLFLKNSGKDDALKINITLSDDFETKRIVTHTIRAGASETIEIPVRPKHDGHVPLDITLTYQDSQKRTYEGTTEFWIDVIDRVSGTSTPSHVAGFTPQPQTPTTFPIELASRYTADVSLIGKGGFGRVFRATRKDGTTVAVKIPISIDAATGKSFIAELQSWTRLSHPNIVKLYDYNIMPIPYFEMEYCSDGSLAERAMPMEPRDAAWIIFSACEGLKVAHNQRIIHRDLKPHNILMKNGVPKVSDWGLAKMLTLSKTSTSASFTPHYAAPEQISNAAKDERTDIWQMGVIFYELVTGILPFEGENMMSIMFAITSGTPIPPREIVADAAPVEEIILKCLEKEPKKRYQSVLELQRELARYLELTYTEELKKSVTAGNMRQATYYCGELVLVALHTGDLKSAYKYLQDLLVYAKGETKQDLKSLADTMQFMVENEMEVSEDILMKADLLVHRMRVG